MRLRQMMTATLCALALTSCGGGERPRSQLIPIDRAKLAACVTSDDPTPPELPAYDAATLLADTAVMIDGMPAVLPAGTRVVGLVRVRERDGPAIRYTVAVDGQRAECKSAAIYADDMAIKMGASR